MQFCQIHQGKKEKKKDRCSNKIRNEKGEFTKNTGDIQRIIQYYYEQ